MKKQITDWMVDHTWLITYLTFFALMFLIYLFVKVNF